MLRTCKDYARQRHDAFRLDFQKWAGTKMGVNTFLLLDETIYEKTMRIEDRIRLCQRKIVKKGPKWPNGPKD